MADRPRLWTRSANISTLPSGKPKRFWTADVNSLILWPFSPSTSLKGTVSSEMAAQSTNGQVFDSVRERICPGRTAQDLITPCARSADDDLSPHGGLANLNTGVAILSKLVHKHLVQLSVHDAILNELREVSVRERAEIASSPESPVRTHMDPAAN